MLTQIDVVYGSELGESALSLPILGLTPKDGLLLRKVTGLNPPDRDLFIGDFARDGGLYQGGRVGVRNVVMTVDLNPNPALGQTVSGLRRLLYQIFMDPDPEADYIELVLHDDELPPRNLVGYTEKFEGEPFDVETMVQASIVCPDPFIRDVAETEIESDVGVWTNVPLTYQGSATTGFEFEVLFSTDASHVTLSNNGRMMGIVYPFLAGDRLVVNTQVGSRKIDVYRMNGPGYSLLGRLTPESRWLELHASRNNLSAAPNAAASAGVKTVRYRNAYWGA